MDEVDMIVAKAIEFATFVSTDDPARKAVALEGLQKIAKALGQRDPRHKALAALKTYLSNQQCSSR